MSDLSEVSSLNWELIITAFGIVLGSNVTLELIKWLFKRDNPERLMLKALGGDALYKWLCDWKHENGGTAAEWAAIDQLYDGYTALGGNGEIGKLYEECKKIPSTD